VSFYFFKQNTKIPSEGKNIFQAARLSKTAASGNKKVARSSDPMKNRSPVAPSSVPLTIFIFSIVPKIAPDAHAGN
jgi:hypothetical protein